MVTAKAVINASHDYLAGTCIESLSSFLSTFGLERFGYFCTFESINKPVPPTGAN